MVIFCGDNDKAALTPVRDGGVLEETSGSTVTLSRGQNWLNSAAVRYLIRDVDRNLFAGFDAFRQAHCGAVGGSHLHGPESNELVLKHRDHVLVAARQKRSHRNLRIAFDGDAYRHVGEAARHEKFVRVIE